MKVKVEKVDRKKIGSELRDYRKTHGIRQDFIAKKLRIDQSKLCRMEKGDFGPWSPKLIERWKAALGFIAPAPKTNGHPQKKTPKKRK